MILRYGEHPSQYGELTLPDGPGPWPVAVVVHGGFWRPTYGLELGRPLAADLVEHGVAAWNVEYRRVGDDPVAGGGGWPTTCLDVAAAVDLLAGEGQRAAHQRLDLRRVVPIGHSAGGHLAGWLAARATLPSGAPGGAPVVKVSGFVSQAGVLDLADGARQHLGAGAVDALLGTRAGPEDVALASPVERVPLGVASVCLHGTADDVVPLRQSERFVAAATKAGDDARLVRLDGADHSDVVDPRLPAWAACREALLGLLR
ncbi:MAG TPA: prolyl oligopeptidase family serine peptidase [Propionibacteriaceae bacterium]|nr:prolyl oligopeptidase family serine peptidase [Propionibacteriaceae bacterium]